LIIIYAAQYYVILKTYRQNNLNVSHEIGIKLLAVKVGRVAYNKENSRLSKSRRTSGRWLVYPSVQKVISAAVAIRKPSQIPKCTLEPRDATESLPYSGLRLDSLTVIPPAENYPDTVSLFSKNILTTSLTASAILPLHCWGKG